MNTKLLIGIASICVVIVCILLFLIVSANLPNLHKNGFTRNWAPGQASLVAHKKIEAPLEAIIGTTINNIFFSVPNGQWLLMSKISLTKLDTFGFGLRYDPMSYSGKGIAVDSPFVRFITYNIPRFFNGRIDNWRIDSLSLNVPKITKSTFISDRTCILRILDTSLDFQEFQKIDLKTSEIVCKNRLFPKQQIGGFDKDGILMFDNKNKKIIFTEYYTNKFYCLDTNLNLVYTGNTIDTTSTNSIQMKFLDMETEKRLMPSNPRVLVNIDCWVENGILYVLSNLKSDNQSRSDFKNNSTIDLYSISNAEYLGSILVPLIENKKIKSFVVKNDKIITLSNNYIGVYDMKDILIKHN